jgi:Protein of unknown function (DUF2798)
MKEIPMPVVPRRYSHFVFGAIQSGLTCLIAAAIATLPAQSTGGFLYHWLLSWIVSWATMMPIVLLAAPRIRALTLLLTREGSADGAIH